MSSSTQDLATKYVRTRDVVHTDMDGETVMMDVMTGNYFALTGSGGWIWDALDQARTFSELRLLLEDAFEIRDDGDTDAAITDFLEQLLAVGLVQVAN